MTKSEWVEYLAYKREYLRQSNKGWYDNFSRNLYELERALPIWECHQNRISYVNLILAYRYILSIRKDIENGKYAEWIKKASKYIRNIEKYNTRDKAKALEHINNIKLITGVDKANTILKLDEIFNNKVVKDIIITVTTRGKRIFVVCEDKTVCIEEEDFRVE